MQFVCKNLPIEHHNDVACPHCTLSMHINDWMLSLDAREYIAEMKTRAPNLCRKFADDELMAIAMVGGLSIVLSRLVYGTGNTLLEGYFAKHLEQTFNVEAQMREQGGQG